MVLEWRARDNRYESCSAFIDTAEESIDARFSCPGAWANYLEGSFGCHQSPHTTPPHAALQPSSCILLSNVLQSSRTMFACRLIYHDHHALTKPPVALAFFP